jgi:hypothetical protein
MTILIERNSDYLILFNSRKMKWSPSCTRSTPNGSTVAVNRTCSVNFQRITLNSCHPIYQRCLKHTHTHTHTYTHTSDHFWYKPAKIKPYLEKIFYEYTLYGVGWMRQNFPLSRAITILHYYEIFWMELLMNFVFFFNLRPKFANNVKASKKNLFIISLENFWIEFGDDMNWMLTL